MKLLSHTEPQQTWGEHVSGVLRLQSIFRSQISAIKLWDNPLLHPLSSLTAGFHDLAKATSYFQKYIRADQAAKNKWKGSPLYRHTPLSALICYYVVENMYARNGNADSLDPFIAYMIVRRHHSPLISLISECSETESEEIMLQQAATIPWEEIRSQLLQMLDEQTVEMSGLREIPFSVEHVSAWIREFPARLRKHRRHLVKNSGMFGSMELYLKTQILFSMLIDADKSQVGIRNEKVFLNRPRIEPAKVERYVSALPAGAGIHALRERAWNEIRSFDLNTDSRIFMLHLPTGLGKTLNALHFALRLKNKREQDSDGQISPRIIYALPFLSIIDQNASVFQKVLFGEGKSSSAILLKHHHMAERNYEVNEEEDEMMFDRNASQLLIEGWNSEIVVTTFVQLFQTLIGNRNSTLRKFHRLAHSILLVDEFQSMPVKYWPALRELFLALAEWLDCRIVFLTATDPKIFHDHEIRYLCDRHIYFQSVNRLTLHAHLDRALTLREFADQFEPEPGKKVLVIVNTVTCAVQLFRILQEKYWDRTMTLLSTHVLPKERLERIRQIRNREFDIVVSTQLVEAGVDIDFDVVYRDWAPLDSIYQSAGRCNRHGDRAGELHVVRLVMDNGRAYAPLVYGGTRQEADNRLVITRQLLEEHPMMSEAEFLELVEVYFERVKAGKAFRTSEQLLRAMRELVYTGESVEDWMHAEHFPLEHFRMIDEDVPKVDVYFIQDVEAERLWNQYVAVQKLPDPFERYNRFLEIKAGFYQYVLSLPANMKNRPPVIEGMHVVDRLQMDLYYDPVTGYRNEDVTIIY